MEKLKPRKILRSFCCCKLTGSLLDKPRKASATSCSILFLLSTIKQATLSDKSKSKVRHFTWNPTVEYFYRINSFFFKFELTRKNTLRFSDSKIEFSKKSFAQDIFEFQGSGTLTVEYVI